MPPESNPFRWDEERRLLLRAELDSAYILDTVPIVKRKDIKRTTITDENGNISQPGTYITKDTILSIYDEMQTAINTGQPYQIRLDPPPGPPHR